MSRLSDRVQKLETRKDAAPGRVVLYFKDEAGAWRESATGAPLPTEAERERSGIFAIRIGTPEDFEPRA